MFSHGQALGRCLRFVPASLAGLLCWASLAAAQMAPGYPPGFAPQTPTAPGLAPPTRPAAENAGPQALGQPVQFKVQGPSQRLEMIVNTSRILTLDHKVPQAQVNNPDVARLTPLSPNQLQITAVKPGVTQVNLWDDKENIYSVDVIVYGDARELQMLINTQFPDATVRVIPLASSVLVTGSVPRPEMVSRITRIAEDFYPKVVNNMHVEGVQTVLLHVKVMEVSRTKLRRLGFDFAEVGNGGSFMVSSVSGLISAAASQTGLATGNGETVRFGIVNNGNAFFGFVDALRQNNMVKLLAEPTLVTTSGRPASFNVGGEFPILIPSGLGTVSVQFKEFGTRVDFVPIVLGNGNIRLETRPQVSEIDNARSVTINATTVPGLRTRWVDTAVEMKSGQTLALAGLIQQRDESENRGIPWLADLPWFGAPFRRVQNTTNEIELLIMVRPELVDALEPHETPQCGPGQFTTNPADVDLYYRGYLEVPKCCTDGSCPECRAKMDGYEAPGALPPGMMPSSSPSYFGPAPTPSPTATRNPNGSMSYAPQARAATPPVARRPQTPTQPAAYGPASTLRTTPPATSMPNAYGGSTPAPVSVAPEGGEPTFIGPQGYDIIDYGK